MTDEPTRSPGHVWSDFALIEKAFTLAHRYHGDAFRKETTIPYLSHLWSVAALVLEHGGTDTQVAAALLHDAPEDAGGQATLAEIRAEVGDEVADLVEHLSDSLVDTATGGAKEPWPSRKARYLASLADAPTEALLVSACDKLHNARCILADHRALGAGLWTRFNQHDPAAHAWYYDTLARTFEGRVPDALAAELRRTVDELISRLRSGEAPDIDQQLATRRQDGDG